MQTFIIQSSAVETGGEVRPIATSADTWHILEQRFHEIGSRDHNVVMQFHKDNVDECTYSLSGPVPDGEYRLTLIGPPLDGSTPKADFSTGHYSVSELWDTLNRAGRLLNAQQQHQGYDHDGAKRFVALLVKFFGELAHEDGNQRFFANSARACGMMAGKLAAGQVQKPPMDHSDDFNSVFWFGKQYTFTVKQAKVIETLWRAWERKTPAVPLVDLLEAADSTATRLRDVFKSGQTVNPAWKDKMIINAGKGAYRLSAPKSK